MIFLPLQTIVNKDFEEYIKTKGEPVAYYSLPEFKNSDLVINLTGDGMREKYCSGDKIALKILSNADEIIFGFDYAVWLNDSVETALVRQILQGNNEDTLILHAYNPIREDMIIPKDKIKYVGRIIALIRTNL